MDFRNMAVFLNGSGALDYLSSAITQANIADKQGFLCLGTSSFGYSVAAIFLKEA